MSESQFFTFDDPEKFRSTIRAGTYELFVKSRGDFHAELTRIDLERLWMQRGDTNLSWIMAAAVDPKRAPILFLADADQAPIREDGLEVSPGEIVVYRRQATNRSWATGSCRQATMSLTHEDLAEAGEAIAGCEITAPPNTCVIRPASAAMAQLTALHKAAGELAKQSPVTLANPGIAHALEQKLMHAMVTCLSTDLPAERRFCSLQHSRVINRFERFLEAKQYQPVYLAEICAAIGASERTLRTCCQEHYGMGPVRYLWLRRMHLARRALLRADATALTVTAIAADHGFWEFGRFSVEYRTLFGELPSVSLHRPPGDERRAW